MQLEGSERVHTADCSPVAISRHFVAEPQAAPAARRVLKTLLWDLDPTQSYVAALLTTELIANGVEHAGAGADTSVQLDVALTDERLRVEVVDEGSGFVPAPRSPDTPLDSHWGLHLVEELADRWGVVPEPQTLVWFELDRPLSADARSTPTAVISAQSNGAH
jgi:anti-sigma regulatory factor (Ser/Thr protein kinase)